MSIHLSINPQIIDCGKNECARRTIFKSINIILIKQPILQRVPTLIILVAILLISISSFSQEIIEVDNSFTVEDLIQNVLGNGCSDIRNITFTGDQRQIGKFNNGNFSISMDEGIFISTGVIDSISQSNRSSRTGHNFLLDGGPQQGDQDLADLANVSFNNVFDPCIIEFDFVPQQNMVSFEYVFASEEYCEFVNDVKNDVFGFFLSGPGISGPFSANAENIALVPGNSNYISINQVNHNRNQTYFIDNTPLGQAQAPPGDILNCDFTIPVGGFNNLLEIEGLAIDKIAFDGFTTVLTATYAVVPGALYHLKMALSDIDDYTFDSGVFLKANSFNTGEPISVIQNPDTLDCSSNSIILDGQLSTSGPSYFYNWLTNDGRIIGANDNRTVEVDLPGTYYLITSLLSGNCADTATIDVLSFSSSPKILNIQTDTINCIQNTSFVIASIQNDQDLNYQIIFPDNSLSPISTDQTLNTNVSGLHRYVVQNTIDFCSDTAEFLIVVDTIKPTSSLILIPELLTCINLSTNFGVDVVGQQMMDYLWETTNGNILGSNNSTSITVDRPGQYKLTSTNRQNHCTDSISLEVYENVSFPNYSISPDTTLTCLFPTIELVVQRQNSSNFMVDWSTLNGQINGNTNNHTINISQAGLYFATITNDSSGCISLDTVQVQTNTNLPMLSLANKGLINCIDPSTMIEVNYSGPEARIIWTNASDGIIEISADSLTALVNKPGNYRVIAELLEDSCTDTLLIQIENDSSVVTVDLGIDLNFECKNELTIQAVDINAGQFPAYLWKNADGAILTDSQTLTTSETGSYILEVTNTSNGCQSTDTIVLNQSNFDNRLFYHPVFIDCNFDVFMVVIDSVFNSAGESISLKYNGSQFEAQDTIKNISTDNISAIIVEEDCEQIASLNFNIPNELHINIQGPDEKEEGEIFSLHALTNRSEQQIVSQFWTPDSVLSCTICVDPFAELYEHTNFTLAVEDIFGCLDTVVKNVQILRTVKLYAPNIFSPNDDGINDIYQIYTNHNILGISSFQIFDRWGTIVFDPFIDGLADTEDIQWDGMVHQKLAPIGTYVYIIEYMDIEGVSRIQSGDILLFK